MKIVDGKEKIIKQSEFQDIESYINEFKIEKTEILNKFS